MQEFNLHTSESHVDLNPFTLWLRYTCTKHTRTVPVKYTSHFQELCKRYLLSSRGDLNVEKTVQQRVLSWFIFHNSSSRKCTVHIRGLVFPLPHRVLFLPVTFSVAITTPLLIRPATALDRNKQETSATPAEV